MSAFVAAIGRRGRFLVAEPLFEPGPQVGISGGVRVRGGELALVEPRGRGARVVELLGDPDCARDVVVALLAERGIDRGFRPELDAEAEAAAARVAERPGKRRDLRDLPTFTVDPETARDFDDAVSAVREGDGIRLWIHIADVAAHVKPGSALDREAYRRGNSTYVPGAVEPMLPHALSSGACSLAAGVDRLAVTTELLLAADGATREVSFYRSRVRSDRRLSYDDLDAYFAGKTPAPAKITGPLELARKAAAALRGRRSGAALEVTTTEPEFEFDDDGHVVAAHEVEQTEAHQLIEQLMILTNERVADLCQRRGVPTLYRIHELPDPMRAALLIEQLASLDVPTPPLPDPERMTPRQAGDLVAQAARMAIREAERRGHGRTAYTTLVLRSLKQAAYSYRNVGHAGLGSPAYSHFTSPIRRYPDLIAHRALLSALGESEDEPSRAAVREAGPWCSERERDSMRVERAADSVCAAFLLERELFEGGWTREFEGEVSGTIGAGAFVRFAGELADVYEGFLPARRLGRERFDLNSTETALVGRRSGRQLRLGDPVRVRVENVEAARGRVDLVPVPEEGGR